MKVGTDLLPDLPAVFPGCFGNYIGKKSSAINFKPKILESFLTLLIVPNIQCIGKFLNFTLKYIQV